MQSSQSQLASRPDGELLRRYLDQRDDAALTELITRHAALVRGVCRRVLGDTPDADDAFQATFLVLVRSGGRILRPQSLAAWLFGVAHRIAKRHRRQRGVPIQSVQEDQVMIEHDPLAELATQHDISVFDAELARLPEKYRAPIVLHHLEGKTQRQVAAELHQTEAAVDGLLKRGRNELRLRLARQGVFFGLTLTAVQAAHHAIAAQPPPDVLIQSTVRGMLLHDPLLNPDPFQLPVARLAEQELSAMALFQVSKVTAWTLVGSLFLGAAGVGVSSARNGHFENRAGVIAPQLVVAQADAEPIGVIAEEEEPVEVVAADVLTNPEKVGIEVDFQIQVHADAEPSKPEESETKKPVVDILHEPTKVAAEGVPLRDVLKLLSELHKIPIRLDGLRIGADGLSKSPDQLVNLTAQDAAFKNILQALLEPVGLDYVIETDGLRITSAAAAKLVHGGKHISRVVNRSHAGESIAIVGTIDLDGDGQSDRNMFYHLLLDAGIKLADFVDDEGKRAGEALSNETKFLVIGSIPDPRTKRTRAERDQAGKVMAHLKELRKEAQKKGIRIVSFNDFLDYIGQPKANPVPDPETPRPKNFRQFSPNEARIGSALREQTEVRFSETSLRDALEYVEDLHNIDVHIKEVEITEDGGSVDQQVNLELSGIMLDSALDLILQPLGLDYIIDKEVLLITTTQKAAEHQELRVYNLEDFRPMFGDIDFEDKTPTQRILNIQKAVAGEWEADAGVGGTMSLTPAGLIVRQNQRTHREIENLIEQLRRAEEAK